MADDRADLVKQVKEANDIVAVVGSYLALRPVGATFKGLCPFHDDHRPSFDVDPRRQRYRCWSCGKYGDVLSFVQEHERASFAEALELLARRAGIVLDRQAVFPESQGRALLLDAVRWAAAQFHECLLDDPLGEVARKYLGERGLTGETVRRFGLGFAPLAGDWLLQRARQAGVPLELLEKVGLVAARLGGKGHYDRFRDRVMFPIRDPRGHPVGFGGRILPSSPYADRGPKYYNSSDTPLFSKKEHLYGLDQARQAGTRAGYLAIVEGYTDVLMAHQLGVPQVVAPMGTAVTAGQVCHLRRFAPRVVLVFDADAGGNTGVDRALEIFVSQEVDLAIAALPEGMDPYDLMVRRGPEPFVQALQNAVDALDFKLNRVLAPDSAGSIEGKRRAMDAVLGVIALVPETTGQAGAVKRELMINRIAQRLGLREQMVWARLRELRSGRQRVAREEETEERAQRQAPAPPEERELLEVLLAEPALVPVAAAGVTPGQITHPGLRRVLEEMYRLQAAGETPDLDRLRLHVSPALAAFLLRCEEVGRLNRERPAWLHRILATFRNRQVMTQTQELQNQLHAAGDHARALALLRQLQNQTGSSDPGAATGAGTGS